VRPSPRPLSVAVIMIGLGVAIPSHGDEGPAEIDPTGGLRSRAVVPQSPPIGISREELVRQWDLDGNGTIEPSEVNVARARMRRARMEMEMSSGIDPLTGQPRGVADAMPEEVPEDPNSPGVELPPEPRTRAADEDAPPGTRVPGVGPAVTRTTGPRTPSITSSGSATGNSAGARPTAPGPSALGSRPGSLTGGIRAGAPAARSGYGSLAPKPDLNAGLPRPAFGRPVLSGTRANARGGFIPSLRSPVMPRPAPGSPGPMTPPRVTADEIGGY